ncbi:HD domain-containing protein [Fusobacterium massiliense]|uniref:HD domain-containing protein n=1 Tax=Fusobacterium massiliense TaxID=1852365 RepID=UPI0028D4820A|nr:HD domain-containing protein [Fusobacterium massiliense]
MLVKNEKSKKFIDTLLNYKDVKNLELCDDQGVKVTTHTYDVLNISRKKILGRYKTFDNAKEKIDFFVITVGIIIHDISKSSLKRNDENLSHSQMMIKNPEYILKEVYQVLSLIEKQINHKLKKEIKRNIGHIVLSHHGKWGKIQPETEEAEIVYLADMESAKYHRINPIQANDILKYTVKGLGLKQIAEKLDCSESVIKDRIKRAKSEVKVKTFAELVELFKEKGRVPIGDKFFVLRSEETKKLKKYVDEKGFYNLFMQNPLMEYMIDGKIFEEENETR